MALFRYSHEELDTLQERFVDSVVKKFGLSTFLERCAGIAEAIGVTSDANQIVHVLQFIRKRSAGVWLPQGVAWFATAWVEIAWGVIIGCEGVPIRGG